MSQTMLIKSLTLFSSVSLVILFLAYRTGVFETGPVNSRYIQTSPNGGAIQANKRDSTKTGSISVQAPSQQGILIADTTTADTAAFKGKPFIPKRERDILSSSKSLVVFYPDTSKPVLWESLRKYRLTKRNNKRKK